MAISSTTTSLDQEKFLAARLIQRSMLKLIAASVCDPIKQPDGTGLTANFVRYERMTVPVTPLSEGITPPDNSFSLTTVTVTLDQWGDVITLTDVAQLTTKHPLIQQALELMSDNAQRVIDREIQIVWLAGTNVQYFDGSVTSRSGLASGNIISNTVINKARTTMVTNGAPPRHGPAGGIILGTADSGGGHGMGKAAQDGVGHEDGGAVTQGQAYVGICDAPVMADLMASSTSFGSWASVAVYANQKAIYNGEVGTWLGIRWVETNFIPLFQLLGNTTAAVVSTNAFGTNTPVVTATASGGSLNNGTYGFAVTMKDLTRGFEEFISIAHTMASGGSSAQFSFAFPVKAGFVWNLYFDKTNGGGSTADADLRLVQSNIASGSTVVVTTVPTSSTSKPANTPTAGGNVHVMYLHGNESCNYVALQNLQVMLSIDAATVSDPLKQQRKIGYKFLAKAMIRDQLRILRVELCSTYQ